MANKKHRASASCVLTTVDVLEPRILYSASAMGTVFPVTNDFIEVANSETLHETLFKGFNNPLDSQAPLAEAVLGSQLTLDVEKLPFEANGADVSTRKSSIESLIFIDSRVEQSASLLSHIDSKHSSVVFIEAHENGLDVISQTLRNASDIAAVHVISHGNDGEIQLGNRSVNQQQLLDEQHQIQSWAAAFTAETDLFFYACQLAEGGAGKAFIDTLAVLTQADIAASEDLTGHDNLGGDWDLEYVTGEIQAVQVLNLNDKPEWQHILAEITVDTTDDIFDIPTSTTLDELLELQQKNGEVVSLREAVYAAQQGPNSADTVLVPAGEYHLIIELNSSETHNDNGLRGDLDVKDDTRLIGAGSDSTIIRQQAANNRVIDTEGADIYIEGMTLTGGNLLNNNGGGLSNSHADSNSTELRDVVITGNTANQKGGGLDIRGELIINDSVISDNTTSQGGGGINHIGTATINNTDILRNTANLHGGGINSTGETTLTNVAIVQNQSGAGSGGGIYSNSDVNLVNSTVSENTSLNHGGGVFSTEPVVGDNILMQSNQSRDGSGGAVYANGVSINQSQLSDNRSAVQGGAIVSTSTTPLNSDTNASFLINNSTLANNVSGTDTSLSVTRSGGAVHAHGDYEFVEVQFNGNRLENGNGGAVSAEDDISGTMVAVLFTQNEASVDGGAIYNPGHLDIRDSGFTLNTAFDDGGAVYTVSGITIEDTGFNQNYAQDTGGAVYVRAGADLNRVSFVNNQAENGQGGGIYLQHTGLISFTNTTFIENIANEGGAIYTKRWGSIAHSTFVGNRSEITAAAIAAINPTLYVSSSLFSNNTLTNGDAISVTDKVSSEGFNVTDVALHENASNDIVTSTPGLGNEETQGNVTVRPLTADSIAINAGKPLQDEQLDAFERERDELPDVGAAEFDSYQSLIAFADAQGDIYKSHTSFSDPQLLVSGRDDVRSLVLDYTQARLYWLEASTASVHWITLDDPGVIQTLVTGLTDATALALDETEAQLYISFSGSNARIDRYDANTGLQQVTLVAAQQPVAIPQPISLDSSEPNSTDTTNAEFFVKQPGDLAFDSNTGRLFWVENNESSITTHIFSLDTAGGSKSTQWVRPDALGDNTDSDYGEQQMVEDIFRIDFGQSHLVVNFSGGTQIGFERVNETILAEQNGAVESFDIYLAGPDTSYTHVSDLVAQFSKTTSTLTSVPEVLTNIGLKVSEGNEVGISDLQLDATDVESSNQTIRYFSTVDFQHGQLVVDNNPELRWFTQQQLEDGLVKYVHDGGESNKDEWLFRVYDGHHYSTRQSFSVDVSPINDAPTLQDSLPQSAVMEGGRFLYTAGYFPASDVDTPIDSLYYYFDSDLNAGSVRVNDQVVSRGELISHSAVAAGQVEFVHDGSEKAPFRISWHVTDGEAEAANNVFQYFDFQSVNDAPELASLSAIDVAEGGEASINNSHLAASDLDSPLSTVVYTLHTPPQFGELRLNNNALNILDTFTENSLANGSLTYHHDGSETLNDQITLTVTDGQSVSEPTVITVNVTPVNDLPVVSVDSIAVSENENGAAVGIIQIQDPDNTTDFQVIVSDDRFERVDNLILLKPDRSLDFETESALTITIVVSDESGAAVTTPLTIVVEDQNDSPQASLSLHPNINNSYQLPSNLFVDQDQDPLSYTVTLEGGEPLPDWLVFRAEVNRFDVVERPATITTVSLEVVANDGKGGIGRVPLVLLFDPVLGAAEIDLSEIVPERGIDKAANQQVQSAESSVNASAPVLRLATSNAEETQAAKTLEKSTDVEGDSSLNEQSIASFNEVEINHLNQRVNVHELVAPIKSFGSLTLASVGAFELGFDDTASLFSDVGAVDIVDLSQLASLGPTSWGNDQSEWVRALNKLEEQREQIALLDTPVVGATAGISTGVSFGYLVWLIRGGTLMGSMLSALPAWRFVDPLPVLGTLEQTNISQDTDDESLESIVEAADQPSPLKQPVDIELH